MGGRYFDDEEDKFFYSQKTQLRKYNCFLCQVRKIDGKGALTAHIEERNHLEIF